MSTWLGFDPFNQSGDSGAGGGALPTIGVPSSLTGEPISYGGAPLGVTGALGAAGTAGFGSQPGGAYPTPGGQFPGSNMVGMAGGQPVFGSPFMASSNPFGMLSNLFGLGGGGSGLGGLLGTLGSAFAGGQLGGFGAGLLAPLFGLNSSGAGSTGGMAGEIAGGLLGTAFGMPFLGAAAGDLLGSLLGDWIGGGLPRMAKPEGYVQALMASHDPLQIALAQYLQSGYGRGYDLSEPVGTPFNPSLFGNIEELAARQQFPLNAQGLLSYNVGFQHPVGLHFDTLQRLLAEHPGFPEVTAQQLLSVEPELGLIANVPTQARGTNPAAWSQAAQLLNELNAAESY
jgi:hypothetical protein